MTKVEQKAFEAYPDVEQKIYHGAFGTINFDRNAEKREGFIKGYQQAKKDLEKFLKVVERRETGYSQLKLGLTPWTFSHVIGAYFNRFMITDRKFTVDSDICTHCGRCAKVCPVGDITFDGTPVWKHDGSCTCCLSCYHHCPVHAINYGQITRRRGQYYFGHRQ